MSTTNHEPVIDLAVSTRIEASPGTVYATASDITRMGEWSPENTGGEWVRGEPGAVGSRFTGHNRRGEKSWSTECEVVAAELDQRFAWAVLLSESEHNMVWSFEIEPESSGTVLTQRFRLAEIPAEMLKMLDSVPAEERESFFDNRVANLEKAMRSTVDAIKDNIESS